MISCAGAGFTSSAPSHPDQKSKSKSSEESASATKSKDKQSSSDKSVSDSPVPKAQVAPVLAETSTVTASTTSIATDTTPPEVLDGQEVIPDCDRCLARAQTIGSTIGLIVDKANTVNKGFYKIDPSRNLCDVHFVPNLQTPIEDHDGQDSILGNQIALYCPCNCGWAINPFIFP